MMNIKDTVAATLRAATEPMAARDIFLANDEIESVDAVSSALYALRKDGLIRQEGERAPDNMKRRAKPVKTFISCENASADADEYERLAAAVEATLGDDEKALADQVLPADADPILDAIQHSEPLPPIEGAEIHAERLLAMAAWPALDYEVADWLAELAGIITMRSEK